MRALVILRRLAPLVLAFLRDRRRWLIAGAPLQRAPEVHRRRAERLVAALSSLGPSFVKIGQLFAGRTDLLPEPYADALSRLTDQVPPAPFDTVRATMEAELGRPLDSVFERFDPVPIAAGSLGQVYRARYASKDVVVKVLRPGVHELVREDLAVATGVVRWLARRWPNTHTLAAEAVLEEFGVRIWDEMDFAREAANLRTVRTNFAGNPRVRIPAVFDEVSGQRVLVLEYMAGTRIDALDPADRYAGMSVPRIVERLVELYLQMMLVDGVFHADPHPGNLLLAPDGAIVLLDFGVMVPVPRERRRQLVDTVFAALRKDALGVTDGFYALDIVAPGTDRVVIERLAALLIDLAGRRTTTQERIDLLTHEVLHEMYDWPVRLPSDLVYYARAAALIEGIGVRYDPRFNPIEVAAPVLFRMRGRLMDSLAGTRVAQAFDLPTVIGYLAGRAYRVLFGKRAGVA